MGKALVGFSNITKIGQANNGFYGQGSAGASGAGTNAANFGQTVVGVAGSLSNMTVKLDASNTTRVYKSNTNGSDGNLSISPADGASGFFSDTTHSDSIAQDDKVTFHNTSDTNGSGVINTWTTNFTATSGHSTFYSQSASFTFGVADVYASLAGRQTTATSTAADIAMPMRVAGSFSRFGCNVNTNSAGVTNTVNLMVNGSTSGCTASIGAGLTGFFTDTTHTATVASGDDVNVQCAASGGGSNVSPIRFYATFTATSGNKNDIFTGQYSASNFSLSTTTQYAPIIGAVGRTDFFSTTEGDAQIQHGFTCQSSNLRCHVNANTGAGTATLRLRVNNANVNQVVTIGSGLTGTFEDTTHSDTFQGTDTVNYSLVSSSTNSIGITTIGLTENEVVAGSVPYFAMTQDAIPIRKPEMQGY